MKIAYIQTKRTFGLNDGSGYSTHIKETIKAFERLNNEVMLVDTETNTIAGSDKSSRSHFKNALKRVSPSFVWESLKDLRRIIYDRKYYRNNFEKVKVFDPDILYERASEFNISGVRFSKNFNVPIVLEYNDPLTEEDEIFDWSPLKLYEKKLEKKRLKIADRLIVVSSPLKEYFSEKGFPEENILVLPNAANADLFDPDNAGGNEIRESLGLEGKKIVGFVGSFFKWHSIDVMIKTIPDIVKTIPNYHLLIVGHGNIREDLENLASETGVEQRVTFTGKVPLSEVPHYVDAMDIAGLAGTQWYCSPIKIFEYGMMGKPVIAPDTVSVRDVMTPGKDGILVKPGSEKEFRKAVLDYHKNPEYAKECALNFQRKINSEHTWEKNAHRSVQMFSEIIKR